jgi:hypothetical protein
MDFAAIVEIIDEEIEPALASPLTANRAHSPSEARPGTRGPEAQNAECRGARENCGSTEKEMGEDAEGLAAQRIWR